MTKIKKVERTQDAIREEMYKKIFNSTMKVDLKFQLVDLMYELSEASYNKGIQQGIVIMRNTYKIK